MELPGLAELASALGNESGDDWGRRRRELQAAASAMGRYLDDGNIDLYCAALYGSDASGASGPCEGGFSLGLAAVTPWRSSSAELLGRIFDRIRTILDENTRLLALVGSPFRFGFLEVLESVQDHSETASLWRNACELVRNLSDDDLVARGIEGIARHLSARGGSPIAENVLPLLVGMSAGLSSPQSQSKAIAGLLNFGGQNAAVQWVSEFLRASESTLIGLREDTDSSWSRSPKTEILAAMWSMLAQGSGAGWWTQARACAERLAHSFRSQEALAGSFTELATLFVSRVGRTDGVSPEEVLSYFSLLTEDSARKIGIGRFADSLGEQAHASDPLLQTFDHLAELAQHLTPIAVRIEALSDCVYSVASGLSKLASSETARSMFVALVEYASKFRSAEPRSDYLRNLAHFLEDATDGSFVDAVGSALVKAAGSIRDPEAQAAALGEIANQLAIANVGDLRRELVGRVLAAARRIRSDESRAMALYESDGLLEGLVKSHREPWARELLVKLIEEVGEVGPEELVAEAISECAGMVLTGIEDESLAAALFRSLVDSTLRLSEYEARAVAIEGLSEGLAKSDMDAFRRAEYAPLARLCLQYPTEKGKVACLLAFTKGTTGSSLDHSLQKVQWVPELYLELIHQVESLCSSSARLTALVAPPLESGGWTSIACGAADLANEDWERVYEALGRAAHQMPSPEGKLGVFLCLAENAFGNGKVGKNLRSAPWLKEMFVSYLTGALEAICEVPSSWRQQQIENFNTDCAALVHFLTGNIDVLPSGNQIRLAPETVRRGLLAVAELSEEVYEKKRPFSDEIEFSIQPRVEFLRSLIASLPSIVPASDRELLRAVFQAISLCRANSQGVLWKSLIRRLTACPNPMPTLIDLLEYAQTAGLNKEAVSDVARFALLAIARMGEVQQSIEQARQWLTEHDEYEFLWVISTLSGGGAGQKLLSRLESLAAVRDAGARESLRRAQGASGDGRSSDDYEFDVAISFAGPDRASAERIATSLKEVGLRVYYDRDFEADLWGEALAPVLERIYGSRSLLCLVLLSEHYPRSSWAQYEFSVMKQVEKGRGRSRVLPAVVQAGFRPVDPELAGREYLMVPKIGIAALTSAVVRQVLEYRR